MVGFQRNVILYLAIASCVSFVNVDAYVVQPTQSRILPTRTLGCSNTSPLFSVNKAQRSHRPLYMTSDSEKHSETETASDKTGKDSDVSAESGEVTTTGSSDDKGADGNMLKNVFLMVPLMAKFAIVLVVKLLTDAVVFPILFFIRLLRSVKNKILSISKGFGKKNDINSVSINGDGPKEVEDPPEYAI